MASVEEKLNEYNSHLHRVRLQITGNRIYFRAAFPLKSGEIGTKRTRIASGCNSSLSGLKLAYEKAKTIDAELVLVALSESSASKRVYYYCSRTSREVRGGLLVAS